MNFTYWSYACLALFTAALATRLWMYRRAKAHPPTVLVEYGWSRRWKKAPTAVPMPTPLPHIHILRVGRSSIHKLTEGISMRCCVAGCEEPFYMDGPTVDWMRDWLNATKADAVKVQAIR